MMLPRTDKKSWKFDPLRDAMRESKTNLKFPDQILNSLARSGHIFQYHLFKGRDALMGHINHDEPAALANILLVFDDSAEYAIAKVASEAHLQAALYVCRSRFDMFGTLLNEIVVEKKLSPKSCYIESVTASLPQSELRDHLLSVLAHEWKPYIFDFVTRSKHTALVEQGVFVDLEENVVGARVKEFEIHGRRYEKKWVHDVLRGASELDNGIVDCGNLLNEFVAKFGLSLRT